MLEGDMLLMLTNHGPVTRSWKF